MLVETVGPGTEDVDTEVTVSPKTTTEVLLVVVTIVEKPVDVVVLCCVTVTVFGMGVEMWR